MSGEKPWWAEEWPAEVALRAAALACESVFAGLRVEPVCAALAGYLAGWRPRRIIVGKKAHLFIVKRGNPPRHGAAAPAAGQTTEASHSLPRLYIEEQNLGAHPDCRTFRLLERSEAGDRTLGVYKHEHGTGFPVFYVTGGARPVLILCDPSFVSIALLAPAWRMSSGGDRAERGRDSDCRPAGPADSVGRAPAASAYSCDVDIDHCSALVDVGSSDHLLELPLPWHFSLPARRAAAPPAAPMPAGPAAPATVAHAA